jgi:hypothetical protein
MRVAAAILLVVLAGWILRDLTASTRHDLRDFDSHAVALGETAMWRSYYDHRQVRLFGQMTALLRQQFHLSFWKSCLAGCYAARAAVVFQSGHNRADYQRALPHLVRYYSVIRRASATPFDISRASALELEWWIVHRERGDLAHALAEVAAEIYQVPPERFAAHARRRAEAMTLRDDLSARGSLTEQDWRRIGTLLDDSWSSLRTAVAP